MEYQAVIQTPDQVDQNLRLAALQLTIQAMDKLDPDESVIETAQEFYRFLKGEI